jgi:hypothetical protein
MQEMPGWPRIGAVAIGVMWAGGRGIRVIAPSMIGSASYGPAC